MGNLERQLRELSKDSFETFVNQYLLARYPGADIKQVDGSGGDGGVDSFSGVIGSDPCIWQSKHFPERIRGSQQKQIRKSIKAAFKNRKPVMWTLCVPINLRTAEHAWFQKTIVTPYGGPERIKLLQASDFLDELIHNRPLRDAFFPDDSFSKMMALREVATLSEGRTQSQVASMATEYALQALGRLNEIDPRLEAVYAIGGSQNKRALSPQKGLVLSISEGERTTHLFARDLKAFNLDPLKFSMSMKHDHAADFEHALDTGEKITLPAGSIVSLSTDASVLSSVFKNLNPEHMQVQLIPRLPDHLTGKQIPMRLIAGSGDTVKTLQYVPFVVTRAGRRNIALTSSGALPLEVALIFSFSQDEGATVSLRPLLRGAEVKFLNRVLEFLDELEGSGSFELVSLEPELPLLKETSGAVTSSLDVSPDLKALIEDAAIVSRTFSTELHLPESIMRSDAANLHTLKLIATGEQFFDVNIDLSLTKQGTYTDRVVASFEQAEMTLRIDHYAGWRDFQVFDKLISPGPLTFVADHCRFSDLERLRERYNAASEGDGVPLKVTCGGPCRWTAITERWNPRAAVLNDGGLNRPS